MVRTADLKRAIKRAGKTYRKPQPWERGRTDQFGVKPQPGLGISALTALRPATHVGTPEHSYAWIVVASTNGPPPQQRAWISPALRHVDTQLDLDELAASIQLGQEPQPGS